MYNPERRHDYQDENESREINLLINNFEMFSVKEKKSKLSSSEENNEMSVLDQIRQLKIENQRLIFALEAKNKTSRPQVVPSIYNVGKNRTKASSFVRNMSIQSNNVISSIPHDVPDKVALKVNEAFHDPIAAIQYLYSSEFGQDLIELSQRCGQVLQKEDRVLSLKSPVYTFGDIHGDLGDLKFFSENLWRLGIQLTAGNFLFLGDYVDRGLSSLECVAYLFSLKLMHPDKVFLLRGNHEIRAVNGWEEHYGDSCFLAQCKQRFGNADGCVVWNEVNNAFDRMAIAAVIDDAIFCTHGGIPRPIGSENQLESIQKIPKVISFDTSGVADEVLNDQLGPEYLRLAKDCLWGDPATKEQEMALDKCGFGASKRGGDAICYGEKAVSQFLEENGFSYIIRAHEACLKGIRVSQAARVLTIFSTSKNHGLGKDAQCGCLLIDHERIIVINRSSEDDSTSELMQWGRNGLNTSGYMIPYHKLNMKQSSSSFNTDKPYQVNMYFNTTEDSSDSEGCNNQNEHM